MTVLLTTRTTRAMACIITAANRRKWEEECRQLRFLLCACVLPNRQVRV